MEAEHKNGIRNDNRPENIEWVDRGENAKRSYQVNANRDTKPAYPIACYKVTDPNTIMHFASQEAVAKFLKCRRRDISKHVCGRRSIIKGYKCFYPPVEDLEGEVWYEVNPDDWIDESTEDGVDDDIEIDESTEDGVDDDIEIDDAMSDRD